MRRLLHFAHNDHNVASFAALGDLMESNRDRSVGAG